METYIYKYICMLCMYILDQSAKRKKITTHEVINWQWRKSALVVFLGLFFQFSFRSDQDTYIQRTLRNSEKYRERNTACVWKEQKKHARRNNTYNNNRFSMSTTTMSLACEGFENFFLLLLVFFFFFFTITGVLFDRVRRGTDRSQKNIRHRTRFQNGYVWKRNFLFT